MKRIIIYAIIYFSLLHLLRTCYINQPATLKVISPTIRTVQFDTIELQQPKYVGRFYTTSYCSCPICCGNYSYNRPDGIVYGASGMELIPGYSIAVDTNIIPMGTIVIIDAKEYIAADTGGAVKGYHIDFYCASHEEALSNPNKYVEVYLK